VQTSKHDFAGFGTLVTQFDRHDLTGWVKRSLAVVHMVTYGHLEMGRRKLSTTVYITAEQDQSLKLLHTRTRVPVAEYIRQGIDLVLLQYRDHLPGQVDLALPVPASVAQRPGAKRRKP
jgi:Ribbon-helix-helix domain